MPAVLLGTALAGCEADPHPVDRETAERVMAVLDGRSFRQFDPSVDGNPRKGVILEFHDGLSIWAQHAESGHAIDEWEIAASGYRVEWTGDASEITLHPTGIRSTQQFPVQCSDCVPAPGVSVSIKNVFERDAIAFRINDPNDVLPSPFPVFDSWTRFSEDEYFD